MEPLAKRPLSKLDRRNLLQAAPLGFLSTALLGSTPDAASLTSSKILEGKAKNVVYIFLPGGPPQHETFDPKPEAPDSIRGDFGTIATHTPGIRLCEYLPLLSQQSNSFALLRSMSHESNDHVAATTIMVSGNSEIPPITAQNKEPDLQDTPGIAALAGFFRKRQDHIPTAAVIPEYIGRGTATGRIIPGQTAGRLGPLHDPWLIQAASTCYGWGACPLCFDDGDDDAVFALGLQHEHTAAGPVFDAAHFDDLNRLSDNRLHGRLSLMEKLRSGTSHFDQDIRTLSYRHFQQQAISMITSPEIHRAVNLETEDEHLQETYGQNKFGWSLLLARRLLETGVNMIQVSLGRNGTWDLHRRAFPLLKDYLLPPMDRAVSAFLEDLSSRGLLDETLVVMGGEFGRTPHLSAPTGRRPGRDHWGPCQSLLFAGAGINGGSVVGTTDKVGGYPKDEAVTPEDLAATLFETLGIPSDSQYRTAYGQNYPVYRGTPIRKLFS